MDQLTAMRQKMLMKKKKQGGQNVQQINNNTINEKLLNKDPSQPQNQQLISSQRINLSQDSLIQQKTIITNVIDPKTEKQELNKNKNAEVNGSQTQSPKLNSLDQLRKRLLKTKKSSTIKNTSTQPISELRHEKQAANIETVKIADRDSKIPFKNEIIDQTNKQGHNEHIKNKQQKQISCFANIPVQNNEIKIVKQHLRVHTNPLCTYHNKNEAKHSKILLKQLYQSRNKIEQIQILLNKTGSMESSSILEVSYKYANKVADSYQQSTDDGSSKAKKTVCKYQELKALLENRMFMQSSTD